MRLEHYPIEKFKKEITDIVGRHLEIDKYKIFFFGSRVAGGGNERSDIDIGIEGKEEISWNAMSKIKEDIDDLKILYKIDIVDFKKISADFYDTAIKNIEIIWPS